MPHVPLDFSHLFGNVRGLSDVTLHAHLALYRGYVDKVNEIEALLPAADPASAGYVFGYYSELRRREPVALNGARLHELYFGALGNGSTAPAPATQAAFVRSFGSMQAWAADTRACMSSGHGWTLLVWDLETRRLRNELLATEHHLGLAAGGYIVAAWDAWEHAYWYDYPGEKAAYVTELLAGVHWPAIDAKLASIGG